MVVLEELPVIVFTGPALERDPHQGGEKTPNTGKGLLLHDLPTLTGSPRGLNRDKVCESMIEVKCGHGFP